MSLTNYSIENMVASTDMGRELDLTYLASTIEGAKYEPASFPGLIIRLKDSKTAILIFKSGKVVCAGAKTPEQVKFSIDTVRALIETAGIPISGPSKFEVQNMVASSDLGQEINLNATVISLGVENAEYEPEQFPGVVYRMDKPRVTLLLFGSGKLVCAGAHTRSEIEDAIKNIKEILRSTDILGPERPRDRA